MHIGSRLNVAIVLVCLLAALSYLEAVRTAYALIVFALFYDYVSTLPHLRDSIATAFEMYWVFAFLCNLLMIRLYLSHRYDLLIMIAVVQGSDVLQYLIGSTIGRYRIGDISPRKTWEGYIGAVVTFYLISCVSTSLPLEMTGIYCVLGIAGGLLASSIKRQGGIKDFSNLLGAHGGWLDRTDSLYIPVLYLGALHWVY